MWFVDICDEIVHHEPLTALSHGRTRHLTPEQRNRKGTNDVEGESRAMKATKEGSREAVPMMSNCCRMGIEGSKWVADENVLGKTADRCQAVVIFPFLVAEVDSKRI